MTNKSFVSRIVLRSRGAFLQDLGLRDYARIDGVVQLPPKPKPKDEKPEEIENYHVPTVDELASQLRPSDNSTMIPPWDPPEVEEINPEEARVWTEQIYQDPFFQDMGPYSNPELASQYHSDEVELEDDGVDGKHSFILDSLCFPIQLSLSYCGILGFMLFSKR